MQTTPDDDTRTHAMLKRVMGAEMIDALEARNTIEILLNEDGKLWLESLGQPMRCIGYRDASAAATLVRTIAGAVGAELTRSTPLLECDLPLDGSRVAAQVPPIVLAPTLAIRKHASSVFSIEQYVESGVMTSSQASALLDAIAAHRNILVVGGTGSGKTTLVNGIIAAMVAHDPGERVVVIEDTREIQCSAVNKVQYRTSHDVSMRQLLRATLRMRPDRILVGEVRGGEALDLLMAWNTGHEGGAATLHSNSAAAGLSKLAMFVSMNADAPRTIEPLIAEVVHVLVQIQKTPQGRRVREVLNVSGFAHGAFITKRID
jgi:type IV secretion system protein TrbB